MAYLGSPPRDTITGLFTQDTFTGDGSTTTFDLSKVMPDGAGNEIQVFVDNVRQQFGSGKAFLTGFDGSSEFKRITFSTAPASGASIYVLNPGQNNELQLNTVSDNSVSTAKIQANAVTAAKLDINGATELAEAANDLDEYLIYDASAGTIKKIKSSNVTPNASLITGKTELSEVANNADLLLIYDASATALKKIQRSNLVLQAPSVSSVSPTNVNTGDGTGNHTFVITGTKFTGCTASIVNASGTEIAFDSSTVNSATQITGVIAKSSMPDSGEPYDIKVSSAESLTSTLENQININAQPVFSTAAGSLGTQADGVSGTYNIVATDPESAGNVSFELQSGTIPPGMTTSTVNENGVSKFRITGAATAVSNNTTFSFTIRAVDAASNTSSRAYSITVNGPTFKIFNSSGTLAVPTGITQMDALVVAGGGHGGYQHAGGGGAGGLIFQPNYPVTPGGTLTVTVGNGGQPSGGASPGFPGMQGQDSVLGAPGDPGKSPTGDVLTAKGGGIGQSGPQAVSYNDGPGTASAGGSGGGAGYAPGNSGAGGQQSTQPGDSGAYGFGNGGGNATGSGGCRAGGGGGGAGAGGQPAPGAGGGAGGVGKAYTIADGTSPVYYAGGGGGSNHASPSSAGSGGQGGGGNAGVGPIGSNGAPPSAATDAQDGQANKGGGGGSAHYAGNQQSYANAPAGINQGNGGKGVVIVRWS